MSGHLLHVRPVRPGGFVVAVLVGGSLGAVAPAAWPAASRPPAAAPRVPPQPLVVEAAFSHVDYKTDTATFMDIAVSQGGTRVTAKQARATGLGFKSSTWTFEGNVTILMQPQGSLRCEQAIVEFRNSRITRAMATGGPAMFEQQRTGARPAVQGEADKVVYDAKEDTVRLSGKAWLSRDQSERISGPLLIYSIRDERLEAISPGSHGVHITVTPPTPRKSAKTKRPRP